MWKFENGVYIRTHFNSGQIFLLTTEWLSLAMRLGTWVLFGLFLMFLQLLPIRFTQQNSCCISKFGMKHTSEPYWQVDLSWFNYSYRKCIVVDILNCIHKVLPTAFTMECRVVYSQIFSKTRVFIMCALLFDLNRTAYQSNIGIQLRKRAT